MFKKNPERIMIKKNNKLSKIIIPIAGLGTRMLPATKAIPKEMLPIVGKPIIQYIVEEAAEAGFKEIIFITHSSKYSVENHFDTSFELEATLEKRVKRSLLNEIKAISKLKVKIHSIRQGEARGLGHAILCAKSIIQDNEPFAISLPDMLIQNRKKENNLSLMKKNFEIDGTSSILLGKAKKEEISKYGVVKIKKEIKSLAYGRIQKIVEKPNPSKAPSNLYVAGRYIFNNKLLNYLSDLKPDKTGEIQLTDAIKSFLVKENNRLNGYILDGPIHDCGDKLGYLKANIEFAKVDPVISKDFLKYLKQ
tara:strand:+ start:5451 stop:6371 length:921 start_codon:yes stop_codon:yes gene_type:complete